jgi:hypothetical protein
MNATLNLPQRETCKVLVEAKTSKMLVEILMQIGTTILFITLV